MRKPKKNQAVQSGIHAELAGDGVILKGDGIALRVPFSQPGPGPAKPQAIEPLPEYEFLEVLRLQKLGCDDLDRAAKILGLDRRTIRAGYSESLRTYSNPNAIESGLQSLLEQNKDYIERAREFWPLPLMGYQPSLKTRKNYPQYFRAVPSATYIKQLKGQGKTDAEIAKALQFDEKDFQRWLKDHEQLLSKL